MSYSRRDILDFKTVITAALYNNLQDGIEELFNQIGLVTETGIPKLMVHPIYVVATEELQTTFPIKLSTFDVNTDTVFVQSGRTMLAPEQDFNIVGNNIVLTEGVPVGRTILIYIFKNVPIGEEGSVSGRVIADKTLPLKKLAEMPTASDVGALPIGGGTLSGDILGIYNGHSRIVCGTEVTQLEHVPNPSDLANRTYLAVFGNKNLSEKLELFVRTSGSNSHYKIYGEHNKPFGSYTGNGSATERKISIGGISSILTIYSNYGLMFTTPYGTWRLSSTDSANTVAVSYLPPNLMKFVDGVLTISTNEHHVNNSGVNYSWSL